MESPYRAPSPPDRSREAPPERADSDLLPFWFAIWAASLVHVVFVVVRSGTWDAGATFTGILVLWLPWLLRETISARFRRR